MSDQRKGGIAWTDETWNVVRGCTRVSEGCRHCYAERQAVRGRGGPYRGLVDEHGRWTGEVRLVPALLDVPRHWARPRRVFVNAMSDLFHEKLTFAEIGEVFAAFSMWSWHTYQVLTKRPARMLEFVRWWMAGGGEEFAADWPRENVWLGVSCEDQQRADERIPLLLQTPAAVRWVSAEPLLGPLQLRPSWFPERHCAMCARRGLDWVVVGGESGPRARPFDLHWARGLRDECREARVAFFMKQLGSRPADTTAGWLATGREWQPGPEHPLCRMTFDSPTGKDPAEWPEDLRIREFPR